MNVSLFGETFHLEAHFLLEHELGDINDVGSHIMTTIMFFE